MKSIRKTAGVGMLSLAVTVAVGLSEGIGSSQELLVRDGGKIAFLGDSITQQGASDPGGYVNLVMKGLEANGLKVEAVKAGISGHKSNDMLARVDAHVISKEPDIMTLSCGVNDVWHGERGVSLEDYKTNITAIVDKVQAANIKVVILTSTLIGAVNSENSVKLDAYNDFLRSLASERNLPLADLSTDMKEIINTKGGRVQLTKDGVHMSIKGNEMMARGVLRALGLTPVQMEKAHEAWLDMPDTCPVQVNMTLRQFDKMEEKAESEPNKPSVNDYTSKQFIRFLDAE